MAAPEDGLPITFIDIWTAKPGSQNELAAAVLEIYESLVRHQPGFLGVRLHKSVDGSRVAAYAEWRGHDALKALHEDLAFQSAWTRLSPFVESHDSGIYLVSATMES